jgi:wyosine [tRNA(Phe)-imidazoG37] synthetase (radical SAM superfamily)
MNAYGPVPSRRLGKSLGVNNIPYKICTYACIYCQIGKAIKIQNKRQTFYKTEKLVEEVQSILSYIKNSYEYPEYITIVPDGEPTLDINLGKLIKDLKVFNVPVAVITNASLINNTDVCRDLLHADYVSIKIDIVDENKWHIINKPHRALRLDKILDGIRAFRNYFKGKFVTETMVIKGLNDTDEDFIEVSEFIKSISPDIAYLAIPTRPPALKTVEPADSNSLNIGYSIFSKNLPNVEKLFEYEGNEFFTTDNVEKDLLSIMAVHPMREDAIIRLLNKSNSNWEIVDRLIEKNLLKKIWYKGNCYYLRKF